MSIERPDFLKAYNAVEVPESFLPEGATDKDVTELVDTFFRKIQRSLDLGEDSLLMVFERVSGIDHSFEVFKIRGRGGQALASVMYTYDDEGSGHKIPYFEKKQLTEETVTIIRDLQHIEVIQHREELS